MYLLRVAPTGVLGDPYLQVAGLPRTAAWGLPSPRGARSPGGARFGSQQLLTQACATRGPGVPPIADWARVAALAIISTTSSKARTVESMTRW